MSTIKLIVSDLHVADGDTMLDTFGERQQAALEGLLSAASKNEGSPLGEADDVELIINGDCLDFQMAEPHDTGGMMDAGLAVEKLGQIIAAHYLHNGKSRYRAVFCGGACGDHRGDGHAARRRAGVFLPYAQLSTAAGCTYRAWQCVRFLDL